MERIFSRTSATSSKDIILNLNNPKFRCKKVIISAKTNSGRQLCTGVYENGENVCLDTESGKTIVGKILEMRDSAGNIVLSWELAPDAFDLIGRLKIKVNKSSMTAEIQVLAYGELEP